MGHDIVLPTQKNNFQLYHRECYCRFTALPPKYRKSTGNASLTKNADLSEVNLSPQVTENIELTAEADIIVPEDVTEDKNACLCFFCGKSRKKFKGRDEKL